MMHLLFVVGLMTLTALPVAAHKPSDSYLSIIQDESGLEGQWDIALRDLDDAIGLDASGDGAITWSELKSLEGRIDAYAFSRLDIASGDTACPTRPVDHLVDRHSDGAYAVLRFAIDCPAPPQTLRVSYRLLFDLDPDHRGLLHLATSSGKSTTVVLSPQSPTASVPLRFSPWQTLTTYFFEGVHHMLSGLDHVLYLVIVLLPVLSSSGAGSGFAVRLLGVAAILSAFTAGHALTLTLAVTGVLTLPAQAVEVAIALTIAITAIDNIRPFLGSRRWLIAGTFGLVHGLGFANVLGPLELSPAALGTALVAFNVGLESAQIMIAALLLAPTSLIPAAPRFFKTGATAGSAAAFAVALALVADRSLALGLMPF